MILSIVVPIYNTEASILRQCIDSLLNQTLSDREIILVDDGSEEWCAAICDQYVGAFPDIRVFHVPNRGVSQARNIGIEQARGEYVQFVDADDWMAVDACEILYSYAREHQLDILLSGCTVVGGGESVSRQTEDQIFSPEQIKEIQHCILDNNAKYLGMWPMSPWAKLFRTAFLREAGVRFVTGLVRMQDNVFCLQALGLTSAVGYKAFWGYFYRQVPSSACHKYRPDVQKIFEPTLEEFKRYALSCQASDPELLQSYYVKGIMILVTSYPQNCYLHPENRMTHRERIQNYKAMCGQEPYREIVGMVEPCRCYGAYRLFAFLLKRKWYLLFWILLVLQKNLRADR